MFKKVLVSGDEEKRGRRAETNTVLRAEREAELTAHGDDGNTRIYLGYAVIDEADQGTLSSFGLVADKMEIAENLTTSGIPASVEDLTLAGDRTPTAESQTFEHEYYLVVPKGQEVRVLRYIENLRKKVITELDSGTSVFQRLPLGVTAVAKC